jgi:hypothetical protein
MRREKVRSCDDLQSLSLDDWGFGFIIWIVSCGVSTVVFIIEMLTWFHVKAKWAKKCDTKKIRLNQFLKLIL